MRPTRSIGRPLERKVRLRQTVLGDRSLLDGHHLALKASNFGGNVGPGQAGRRKSNQENTPCISSSSILLSLSGYGVGLLQPLEFLPKLHTRVSLILDLRHVRGSDCIWRLGAPGHGNYSGDCRNPELHIFPQPDDTALKMRTTWRVKRASRTAFRCALTMWQLAPCCAHRHATGVGTRRDLYSGDLGPRGGARYSTRNDVGQ